MAKTTKEQKRETPSKLNLGCGQNPIEGYLNVDKYGNPDFQCDLEVFPWPWESDSVEEIILSHVLEHLGETKEVYLKIIQELYRICKHDALVYIRVPHPRHDDFINDPTHVRVVTPSSFNLFSKKMNQQWKEQGYANSPLATYLNVDFEVTKTNLVIEDAWVQKYNSGNITMDQLWQAINQLNNVAKEYDMEIKVIKDQTPA